jgi:invasion protein IalB
LAGSARAGVNDNDRSKAREPGITLPPHPEEHPLTFATWKFRHLACVAAGTIGLVAGTSMVMAQQAQQQPELKQFGPRLNRPAEQPKPEITATFGAWNIQCEAAGKAAEGDAAPKKICGMVQTVRDDKRKAIGLTIILRRESKGDKSLTMMQVIAPIGVYLPLGVALEVDSDAVGRVPFTRCAPQLCIAVAEASPPTLEKLKKGTTANFIIYEAPGVSVPLAISLKGFTAAFDDLDNYK